MKRISLLLFVIVAGANILWSSDIQIDGIYYNFENSIQTASVTFRGNAYDTYSNEYTGDIVIPASVTYNDKTYQVTSIENRAFFGCPGLTSVNISDGVAMIGFAAFWACTGLTSVTIPNSVSRIDADAFRLCSSLTSVVIPNRLIDLSKATFYDCTGLRSVTIPKSVSNMGDNVFYNCSSLTSIVIDKENQTYDSRDNCNAVILTRTNTLVLGCKNTIIPNSVTSIAPWSFNNCAGLTSVIIPNSVTEIGSYAFEKCSALTSIILGHSVNVIKSNAFIGCTAIESITCYGMVPPTVKGAAFPSDMPYSTIIYVPADYLDTYKADTFWGQYDVRSLSATDTGVDNVMVQPSENTVNVSWPAVTDATIYELVIKGESGDIISTMLFDAAGQLISAAFNAPAREKAPEQTQGTGFSFTITGLSAGTSYVYTLTAKDANGTVLDTKGGSFITESVTAIEQVSTTAEVGAVKMLHDGNIVILCGDKSYTIQGQEVR